MTDNRLLLFRLAELMLEQEKNMLLVDELFDDELIGDYVKSIQIDSPYQQMLLEGVLTETVVDEKLLVSYTIEGYFHYLLGEVIYNQTRGKGPETLLHILEKNKMNATKKGVEQCLILDVLENDLTRLMWFIDEGDDMIYLCVNPLLYSLKSKGPKNIIDKLLEKPTKNDWRSLLELDEQLKELQLGVLRKDFLFELMKKNSLVINEEILLGLIAITELDVEIAQQYYLKFDFNNPIIYENEDIFLNFGKFESKYSNYNKGIDYFQKALEIIFKKTENDNLKIARIYNLLALNWNKIGNYEEALFYQEKSLELILIEIGENNSKVAASYNNFGAIYSKKGDFQKSLLFYEKSLSIKYKTLGSFHLDIATSFNNIGFIYSKRKDYTTALDYYKKSLSIKLKNLGEKNKVVALSYNNISAILEKMEMFEDALYYVSKSLDIRSEILGSQHPDVASSFNTIGKIYSKKSEFDKALNYYFKSLSIRLKSFDKFNPVIAISFKNIGSIMEKLGKFDDAIEYYNKSLEIKINNLGVNHSDVIELNNKILKLKK